MTTIHDNEFVFNIDGLTEVSFEEKDHKISKGQPYDGVKTSGKKVIVKAGRHKTQEVADWFIDKTNGKGTIAKTFDAHHPNALNFAVVGKLTLKINGNTYTSDNFVLAQGSFETHNNWWLGSQGMFNVEWVSVDQKYAEKLVVDTLKVVKDIVSENPVGAVKDSAKLIVHALGKRKVGSGSIAFESSKAPETVEVILFQMDNSDTNATLTGSYSHP